MDFFLFIDFCDEQNDKYSFLFWTKNKQTKKTLRFFVYDENVGIERSNNFLWDDYIFVSTCFKMFRVMKFIVSVNCWSFLSFDDTSEWFPKRHFDAENIETYEVSVIVFVCVSECLITIWECQFAHRKKRKWYDNRVEVCAFENCS